MRPRSHRLAAVLLATIAVAGCDSRLPTLVRKSAPGTPPTIVIDTPITNAQVNLGDSILVVTTISAGNTIKSLFLSGDALTGDPNLGTFQRIPRYKSVQVDFPGGITDTVIRRYLKVLDPANQLLDTLEIKAVGTDSIGLRDSSQVKAFVVSGPTVVILSPTPGDSVPGGVGLAVQVEAKDQDGIAQISIHVVGDPSWPTKLDTLMLFSYDGSSKDVTVTGVADLPLNATQRTRLTVTATAIDALRQPGSVVSMPLFIKSLASIAVPRVTQIVPARSEATDTVVINANGQGIVAVGLIVRDSIGQLVVKDSVPLPPPIASSIHVGVPLNLPIGQQGRHLAVTAFAVDQNQRIGFAVRASTTGSEPTLANALVDSTTIVYGQTYTMPLQGTVGDIAVDPTHGNIFLSNTTHNRLEMFSNTSRTFDPNGIAVGSLPWGMTQSAFNPDTLLVANSGGTNISRVCIANCGGAPHEDLANRILTRNVSIFMIDEARDGNTGKITLTIFDPKSFSDRPQYIAQASTGRIFFSTQPTATAKDGTIRYLDPLRGPAPDPVLIHSYATHLAGTTFHYVIFNLDSLKVIAAPAGSTASDGLYLFDHPYGYGVGAPSFCVNPPPVDIPPCVVSRFGGTGVPDAGVLSAILTLQNIAAVPPPAGFIGNRASDVDYDLRLDETTIGLTDTTFVASSVDRNWIAFGEGNSPGKAGRVMLTNDPLVGGLPPAKPSFFSPLVTITDLTDNASEKVFGLALDKTGKTVASHGLQSYFSSVDDPFHLRLQGKYDSFDDGAGVALHPDADGNLTPASRRLAFIGSAKGTIEIVDIAYFINRGSLALKYPIYGPIRVSQPMLGDNGAVVLKLFALTQRGLIVIDLTAADIKPGPP